eukprot:scaffold246318_cov25-Prasinocladus_malaysianus.AAC.1
MQPLMQPIISIIFAEADAVTSSRLQVSSSVPQTITYRIVVAAQTVRCSLSRCPTPLRPRG